MGNYLHKFNNKADFDTAYYGSDYHEPWVSYTTQDQVLSFTANISRSGGEFGPYDFTFYEEVNHLSISLTDVTGTFYIGSNDSEGGCIVTTTRNITENTYYEHASGVEGSGCGSTSNNVGGSGYTLVNISSVVNETKGAVTYNKRFNGDLIVDYAQAAVNGLGHNGCRIVYAAPNICAEETEYSEFNGYYYNFNEPSVACGHGNKDTLRVRILNLKDTPIDVDFPVDYRGNYYVSRSYSFNDPTMSVNTMNMYIAEGSGVPCGGTINIGEAV